MCSIRVCTFNVLAPCYDTGKTTKARGGLDRRTTTPSYMPRIVGLCEALLSLDADVLCLQEFWENPGFVGAFTSRLASYTLLYTKRSWSEDGVAIFVSNRLHIEESFSLIFNDVGDRVAHFAKLQLQNGEKVLVVNTHLTFPHNEYDKTILRVAQINMILDRIDEETHKDTSLLGVILAGDFNSHPGCCVYPLLHNKGWLSAYSACHGMEARVTHRNHRSAEVSADFIWLGYVKSNRIRPSDAYLFPRTSPDTTFPSDFKLSDHRPVVCTFDVS
ncbi:Low temperature viability protein [Pelomyxa schiedti]|nr:Low temperature viability protein [Pelomyxa schiedti]